MITRYKTNNELLIYKKLLAIHLSSLILSSFFYHFTFFIPIFLDFFLIFSIFFFKGPINSIEVFIGFNPCYSILFINFFSLFFQIQFIILILLINKNNVSKLSNPNTNENIQKPAITIQLRLNSALSIGINFEFS